MRQNKLLKTLLGAALSAALILPTASAAELNAPPAGEAEGPAYTLTQRGPGFPIPVRGQAVELGEQSVTLQSDDEGGGYQKIVINVSEGTLILDAVSGESRSFADIQKDDALCAWVGPAMTRSLPPITTAQVILCNLPGEIGVPTYAEVQSVTKTEKGVDAYMTGDVVLHLSGDTPYAAGPGAAEGVGMEDIVPGTRLLSWYSVVALSMPAQASPEKVMIFPNAYGGWAAASGLEVSINGQALDLGPNAARVENGRLLVPVRAVAEALGCEISWEAYTNRVTVQKDGAELYHFTLGEEQAVQGDVTVGLLTPASAIEGVTCMALDDLLVLHNLKLATGWF